ncbi:MAG: MMPL family transporter, partial [Methanomicrobiales archaeon]
MKIEDLFGRVANVVNSYPKAIIAVMLVLAVIAIIFMATIPPQTESDEFMNKHSPSGMVYDLYNNRYGQDSYVLLITASNPTDPGLLREILVLEKQIKRINHVSSAVSIADVVAEYHGGTIPGTEAEVKAIIDKLPPGTRKQFVPDKETALAYVLIDQGISTDASQNVEPFVVKTIGQATLPPGVSIELTGNTPFNIQLQEAMLGNFSVLIVASMAFMLIVLGLLFSKIRFWILPIVLLVFGLFY